MPIVLAGLALAVSASVAQGAGYLCQHVRAAERPPVSLRSPVRTLASMLGSGWWRVGLLFAVTGFLLHLVALAVAPISLVQAFVAGGLALVAPLAARVFHHRLTRAERRAVPLMAVSLAALSLGIANPPRPLAFDPVSLGLYLAVLLVAALLSPRFRPSSAAGARSGSLLRGAGQLDEGARRPGPAGRAGRRPRLAIPDRGGLQAIAAFFCFQRALQLNRPLAAIAVMEAGATGGGVLAGFIAFGDPLGASSFLDIVHLAAFAGVGVAAWILAPAQVRLAQPVAAMTPSRAGWSPEHGGHHRPKIPRSRLPSAGARDGAQSDRRGADRSGP